MTFKKFIILFSVIFAILMTVSFSIAQDDKSNINKEDELYQKCKFSYENRNFAEASQLIKEFLSQYPQSNYLTEILFLQAGVQTDVNTAIKMYKDIIQKYPNTKWGGRSNFQLAQIYYLQGKYNESAEYYREVVVRYPDDESYWQARYWRCKSLMAKGDYDGAIFALNSLKEIRNKNIEPDTILLSLGECYMAKKEYDKAEVTFKSLIDNYPESKWLPTTYFLLAGCFQNQGKTDDARAMYRRITEGYPQSIEAKQAKKQLDSPTSIQINQTSDNKVFPQLETPFLKATNTTRTQQNTSQQQIKPSIQESKPPFQFQWKSEEVSEKSPKTDTSEKTISTLKSESSFSIQVGAFSRKDTAKALADQLEKKNYKVNIVFETLYKVRVVGFKTREEAVKASDKLIKEEKIERAIVISPE
ncbi:MAG: SPOR domain-containing protein [Candidatus Poribacteria bacterium]